MTALLVIPARGGSQGLPRKNVRVLAGKPLLCHVLETALTVPDARVCVVTDDDEIAAIAGRYPEALVLREPPELARAEVPLDPVVHWAAQQCPEYDPVISLQPTSPFTTAARIVMMRTLVENGLDSAVTVTDDRHLRWHGSRMPIAGTWPARLPRQQMPPAWREIGAVFACRRAVLTPTLRFGHHIELVPIAGREAVDIDTIEDWWVAEGYAQARRILYRVDGGGDLGLGHVYRALTLSHAVFGHAITFVMDERRYPAGVALARARGATVVPLRANSDDEWTDVLDHLDPELILIEIGATHADAVRELQARGHYVVTIEDRGSGAAVADLTFNDLDAPAHHGPQRYQGLRYAVLREEFVGVPRAPWRDTVERVLVTFGGTDPAGYTAQAIAALAQIQRTETHRPFTVDVVWGPGMRPTVVDAPGVRTHHGITVLAPLACQADLAITSCGRTTYELAACGVPTICLPQNAHERRHIDVALQLGARVMPDPVAMRAHWAEAFEACWDADWRAAARAQAARYDLGGGAARFWDIVLRGYRERHTTAPVETPAFGAPCVEVA